MRLVGPPWLACRAIMYAAAQAPKPRRVTSALRACRRHGWLPPPKAFTTCRTLLSFAMPARAGRVSTMSKRACGRGLQSSMLEEPGSRVRTDLCLLSTYTEV
ncbi:unnamed protein product [Amoebophrya sp. A120]|nr:unnamed protein product [Amoebophrya sp. A120]|eukprot:GSA120T00025990001.1